jgi:serine/threonine protein kinase/Tfp pilus assembly protein PilF
MTVCTGSRLGPYEILALLGAGGMGEVYRAWDTRLGRDVAIKVLPAGFATDPERLRRFEQEARAVAALDHPNILAIHDVGTHEGSPYIVTELLEGESLQARLKAGALPPLKAIELAVQLCSGLAAVHERGIIHRDLKPANVFIRKDGHAKIVDFGLAKLVEGRLGPEEVAQAPTLTEATGVGVVLGTVGYMAPEQVRGGAIDHRADIFALGCVLYEMLTCEQPFAGATVADSVVAILTRDPRPLSQCHLDLPRGLEAVVLRCLEKRPEERFDTARDIAFALRAFSQPEAAAGATPPRWGSPPESWPSIAVLPFANLSADPEQEYFCDGMAEEIINALAHVHGLRVVARTSSFAFKGRAEDVRHIGAQLQVATLLEGSVRRWCDRLRITAQLINAADGSHLWSERYDRRLEDVFAIQEEIALAIVENLEVRLLGRERAAITRRATGSLDAHSAFLRSQYYWNTFTPEGFTRSRQNLEEAIRIDPNYAPALSGLGMWYVSQSFWADYPSENARQAASAACERALSSDPEFWLAHTVRGNVLAFFERHWAEAEASLRRGVLYGPGQAQSHFNLAALLVVRRRWEEMAQEARLALRLDPMSAPNCAWNACWLGVAGYRDEASAEIEKILAIAPDHWLPHWVSAMQALGSAHLDKARSEAEKAVELSGGSSMAVTVLACACQALGDARQMGELYEGLRDRARRGHVAPTAFAWIADARRDVPAAVRWLEHAAATHDPLVCFYRTIPAGLLSGDPAIESVLKGFDL